MLKLYHAPYSRSFAILWLLEELGVNYELEIVPIRGEGGPPESYRSIQPNKKVPAIEHDGRIVTERAAIAIYLGDSFSAVGLAPGIDDPMRARYLSALVYHDAVFDPVICARGHGLVYESNAYPFGLFEDMVSNLERRLGEQRYAAGERFTIADVILGTGVDFTMNVLKMLPEKQVFRDYVARATNRPAHERAREKDNALAAEDPAIQRMLEAGGA